MQTLKSTMNCLYSPVMINNLQCRLFDSFVNLCSCPEIIKNLLTRRTAPLTDVLCWEVLTNVANNTRGFTNKREVILREGGRGSRGKEWVYVFECADTILMWGVLVKVISNISMRNNMLQVIVSYSVNVFCMCEMWSSYLPVQTFHNISVRLVKITKKHTSIVIWKKDIYNVHHQDIAPMWTNCTHMKGLKLK